MSLTKLPSPLPCLTLAATLVSAAPAQAQDDRDRAALAHFQRGKYHQQMGQHREAFTSFSEGYRIKPEPMFLFQLGECYRALGDHRSALEAYRRYLAADPRAFNRPDVEKLIWETEARLKAAQQPPPAPPPAAPPPATYRPPPSAAPPPGPPGYAPAAAPGPPAPAAPAPTAAGPAAGPSLYASPAGPAPSAPAAAVSAGPAPAPAADDSSVLGKWWFWAAIGVVAAGAALGAVALSGSSENAACHGISPCKTVQ